MITISANAKALIFDLDGTLADTMPLHFEAWHETLAARGLTCSQDFLEKQKGVPTDKIVSKLNQTFGYTIDAEAFAAEKQQRFRTKLTRIKPIPAVVRIVHQYQNRLPMAVATGGVRQNSMLILKTIQLDDCFTTMVTADDPVAPKPAPDIFLEAARRIKVEPCACQVFEDGDLGLEAARNAGMMVIDVRPFALTPST